MNKRVVITCFGVISSLGNDPDTIIENIKKNNTTFEYAFFDDEIQICPVKNFNIREYTGRYKNNRYLNRGAQFAVASAMLALKNSGLEKKTLEKAGLFVGGGPNFDVTGEFPEINNGQLNDKELAALFMLKFLPNTACSAISNLAGIHGENNTIGTACSASLVAIGEAFRKIKHGYLETAFAGGGDSRLNPGGILAYKKAQALHTGKSEYAPFVKNRIGFVPGEGGAFFLLENLEQAKKNNRKIIAEICGYGNSIDGYNMTAPRPDGKWGKKAVLNALKEANLTPEVVEVISFHGTGTPLNDDMETFLIHHIYKNHKPYVMALKSWIGHLASSCGSLELAITLSAMEKNFLPKIRNFKNPEYKNINFVKEHMNVEYNTILLENFGFGGQNSTLVIKKWTE